MDGKPTTDGRPTLRGEAELTQTLADLSYQIVETRNQMIKTANIIGNLAAEVRQVSRLQQRERRGLNVNSAVAYALFVLLVIGAASMLYSSRVERLDFEKGVLMRERAAAQSKLDVLQKQTDKRRETEQAAMVFYRLIQSDSTSAALQKYPDISQLPLSRVESALFQDWATRTRSERAHSAYIDGMKAFHEKQWKEAVIQFKRSVGYMPNPTHESSLRYYYGMALNNLGSYPEAADELERAIEANAEKYVSKEARYHLAAIYEQMGRFKKAAATYRAYIQRYPATPYAKVAARKLKTLD